MVVMVIDTKGSPVLGGYTYFSDPSRGIHSAIVGGVITAGRLYRNGEFFDTAIGVFLFTRLSDA